MLIDTGFHPAVAVDGANAFGRIIRFAAKGLRMDPEQAVQAQLRELGIDPATIGTVVMTHLHYDHASGVSEFPGATFVVSKQEWDAASDAGQLHGYEKSQFDHAFDWRTIDFEGDERIDSFTPFGRSVDLFGDGSVRIVFTPGHTLGHCSLVLRLRDRDVMLAADAAYTTRTLKESALPYRMEDEHKFKRSLKEIQLYMEGNPSAVFIPGHDMQAWRILDSVYE
jgi:glyoxylase-like metal-dependent hydrolase (beta-lactamase superfamily II)